MRFFWRIFFATWLIFFVTGVATALMGTWVLSQNSDPNQLSLTARTVESTAAMLRAAWQTNPETDPAEVVGAHILEFWPLIQVFVIDAQGQDILERPLPIEVRADLDRQTSGFRTHMSADDLAGFTVIGFENRLVPGALLALPGGRIIYFAILIFLITAVSLLLARFIVIPVRRLQRAGQRVAAGDLSVRVAHTVGNRTDEIAKLARDFDQMTERLEQVLNSQQQLMRDVSHELRSPLARLQALVSLQRQQAGQTAGEHINKMEKELLRLDDLISEILSFNRLQAQDRISRHNTDLVDLIHDVIENTSLEAQARNTDVRYQGAQELTAFVDSELIHSAVENVVRNAIRHTSRGTEVVVSMEQTSEDIHIAVEDQGPGVPEADLEKIFEAFYQVGNVTGGSSALGGVGLAITARSIKLHGGNIEARNREPSGLAIDIRLPLSIKQIPIGEE